ncbi:MAG: DUF5678 domain-containing protein [bacterium]|nr:DUF5678 domain-containing protein [bacterium]
MAKDWSKLYKKYKGLWVALAKDEETVLGVGATAQEALKKAQEKSSQTPFLTHVPETLNAYVGSV